MTDLNDTPSQSGLIPSRGRAWVRLALALWAISTVFPIVASLIPADRLPVWVGWLDVTIAFALVILGGLLDGSARGKGDPVVIQASFRLYRGIAGLLLILLVLFFVVGDRILWNVLLPGLTWRSWLLIYVLPAGLALWKNTQHVFSKSEMGK